ncbi:MAG TPA: hypothetical protein VFH47_00955, partial [Candidatus Thermoplasmatota archaeon]|nr:hypothetical protein [Candidatus Thermoplasmatota archaeon]
MPAKRAWGTAARSPVLTLLASVAVAALLASGATRLRPEADFVDTVPAGPEVDAYREMLARLDGVRFVAIHMPFDPAGGTGHLRTPSGFDQLVLEQQDLTQRVTAGLPPGTVAHTLSAYEAVRQANHMLAKMVTAGNAPPSSYAMPGDPVTYEQARSRALASSEDVLAADGSSALLLVFLTAEAGDARQHARDVQRIASAWHASGGARVTGEPQAAGLLASSAYVDDRNARDVRVWGAVSLAAVSLVLLAVVRRPTDALLAALGLAAATAATFGLVGWLGVRIDFLTVFLAPIVAGIGMDYAVHVL